MADWRLYLARVLCPTSHIVAPREPSRDMLKAAARALSPGRRPTQEWVSVSEKHRIRYMAMIARAEDA